jgi:hypothetical protein
LKANNAPHINAHAPKTERILNSAAGLIGIPQEEEGGLNIPQSQP